MSDSCFTRLYGKIIPADSHFDVSEHMCRVGNTKTLEKYLLYNLNMNTKSKKIFLAIFQYPREITIDHKLMKPQLSITVSKMNQTSPDLTNFRLYEPVTKRFSHTISSRTEIETDMQSITITSDIQSITIPINNIGPTTLTNLDNHKEVSFKIIFETGIQLNINTDPHTKIETDGTIRSLPGEYTIDCHLDVIVNNGNLKRPNEIYHLNIID